ncbi:hypothetical protein DSO57_1013243 [Entomophthora muscae]|uniref:Uncharacterized protein n=1 Tax=Entomophthora muscae TaxID=34485 RepID=A0ACC2SIR8_9FUNG|nr:hypothetical protein DSO57_1013243 [Entomophthora muscae]
MFYPLHWTDHISSPSSPKEAEPTLETPSEVDPINTEIDNVSEDPPAQDALPPALEEHITEPSSPKEAEKGLETSDTINVEHDNVTEEVQTSNALPLALEDHSSEPSSPKETELETSSEQDPVKSALADAESTPAHDVLPPVLDECTSEPLSPKDTEPTLEIPSEVNPIDDDYINEPTSPKETEPNFETRSEVFPTDAKLDGTSEEALHDEQPPLDHNFNEPSSPKEAEIMVETPLKHDSPKIARDDTGDNLQSDLDHSIFGTLVQGSESSMKPSLDESSVHGNAEPDEDGLAGGDTVSSELENLGDGRSIINATHPISEDLDEEPLFQEKSGDLKDISSEGLVQEVMQPGLKRSIADPFPPGDTETALSSSGEAIPEKDPIVGDTFGGSAVSELVQLATDQPKDEPLSQDPDQVSLEDTSDQAAAQETVDSRLADVNEKHLFIESTESASESISVEPRIQEDKPTDDLVDKPLPQDQTTTSLEDRLDEVDPGEYGIDTLEDQSSVQENTYFASDILEHVAQRHTETTKDDLPESCPSQEHIQANTESLADQPSMHEQSESVFDNNASETVSQNFGEPALNIIDESSIQGRMDPERNELDEASKTPDNLPEAHPSHLPDELSAAQPEPQHDPLPNVETIRVQDIHDENEEKEDSHVEPELKDITAQANLNLNLNQEGALEEPSDADPTQMASKTEVDSNQSRELSNVIQPTISDSLMAKSEPSSDTFVSTQEEKHDDAPISATQEEPADDNSETIPSAIQEDTTGLEMLANDNSSFVPTHHELTENDQKAPLQLDNLQTQRNLQSNLQREISEEDHESPLDVQDIESSPGQETRALDKIAEDENLFIPTHQELDNEDRTHAFSPGAIDTETHELNSQEHVVNQDIHDCSPKENEADSNVVLSEERSSIATNVQESTKDLESFLDENPEPLNKDEHHSDVSSESNQKNSLDDNASVQHSVPELLDDDESTAPVHQLSDNISEVEDFTDDGLSMGRVTRDDLNLLSEETCTPDKASTPNMSYENKLSDANLAYPADSTGDSPIADELSPRSIKAEVPSSPTENKSTIT